jgi:GT2 family glycosyltransferase
MNAGMECDATTAAPVSVVIPTIGRPGALDACLRSLYACRPRPTEAIVVDQSGGDAVAAVVRGGGRPWVRHLPCSGRGIPLAVNTGLRASTEAQVAITHDDCLVDEAWVGVVAELLPRHPEAVLTGRVLPVGDAHLVPATRDRPRPEVFYERSSFGAVLPNNMAVHRNAFLSFGAFDERFDTAGEDLDVAHRWAKGTRTVRYEPSMVVHHAHWRTPAELRTTYIDYARGAGLFYAKHALAGDLRVMRHFVTDARDFLRAAAIAARTRRWDPAEPALGFIPGTFTGLWQGLRTFR